MNYIGELLVSFDQTMMSPADVAAITNEVLQLDLIPDQSNYLDDPSQHKFSWKVISFANNTMEIKVTFDQHEYISAGAARDQLKATI